ncbi:efflux RND transporter permease subunit [Pseudohaliea rubra]|uniref:RND multidrug efflux transporter, Acriflavin resistance protein n=1 Tax=Pseudohaliea rubra DSM 19751 TaxID=1265313 RepID=A0A095VVW0_9GAMM|nr:efflux RND transporter permease subunit [Pseudohaliea rubra]KGE05163.1 RND multidrug efflux transporter, Acriflavin resistance protein [Pseudohaliea rubra DSM 19751]
MRLHELSIRRPVLAIVMSTVIVVFGLIGLRELPVREFPLAERPLVSVQSSYPGANATVIENQITERLEEEINSVSGIRTLKGTSREGRSTVSVEFALGDDLDRAANDVRDRVAAAVRQLPDDAEAPTVSKADADGDPIIFLNVRSNQRSLLELSAMADNLFKTRFETIPGVGQVDIWGDKEYAMRLWLDPDALAAHGLTAIDVREAFQAANVELPTGRIEGNSIDLNIRTLSRLGEDPEQFNSRVIKREGDRVVRLRDVGYAELAPLNERTVLRRDGVTMVGVALRPQSGANEIAIADEFYRRLEVIKRDLPEDVEVAIGFDTSRFIRASIQEVLQTLVMALALVCLTIFLFLREWRTTVIPVITIPIALTGTFFVLYLAGFSINVLTLLGLVLAIGLVVDDAIVVVENIYKRVERGQPPRQAAAAGVQEIFFAVIATTLALVAVFAPLVFLGGLTGVLFREFGITLAAAVVISSFVALTLAPMLCSRFLKNRTRHPAFYRATEPLFNGLAEGYRGWLRAFLARRWLAPLILLISFALIVLLYRTLPEELAPLEDRGMLVVLADGPEGAGFDYMFDGMDRLEAAVREAVPEDALDAIITVTSPGFGASTTTNTGFSRVVLTPPEERELSQQEIAPKVAAALAGLPEVRGFVRQPATISAGSSRGLPVQFVVQNSDRDKVREIIPTFLERAQARPEFSFVQVDLKFSQPELVLDIDRDRAEAFGVSTREIADVVQASLSGQRYGYFLKDGEQYEIIGQLLRGARNDPGDLSRLLVRSADGDLLPVDNLVTRREQSSAPVLFRFNRFTAATFSANLSEGYTLGDGIDAMRAVADEVLDESYSTDLDGQSKEFADTGSSLLFVFAFALLLIYLVLAAQFESFRDPLAIMLTVPMALTGGLLTLWYFGQTLSIFSQIGLIMLIGLVTKNGILIVEFANQRRAAGLSIAEAVEDAAAARFRPILMTTLSTVLGTLPIALALGAGAQSRIPLGLAVIGGMLVGSFLSLFIVPAAYRVLASKLAPEAGATGPGPAGAADGALPGPARQRLD